MVAPASVGREGLFLGGRIKGGAQRVQCRNLNRRACRGKKTCDRPIKFQKHKPFLILERLIGKSEKALIPERSEKG